ncbi:MAG TPA: DUF2059 domain-containing protein [Candidatus Sulfotelmatobacter sp.]|nr:DUF2059 domain-containing protein [Candidatus Sulfotelmatobacter sp.]
MKAFLVLAAIYVGAFLIAIQGASQTQAESVANKPGIQRVDPAKDADIRSLMELVGARRMAQDVAAKGAQQLRENLVATLPASERGQQFVNAFVADYQKKFNNEDLTNQLVGIYDKHFTDDEIKGLLQFYGSPLGRKLAAETPKIQAEVEAANQKVSTRVAADVLRDLPSEYAGIATTNASANTAKTQPTAHNAALKSGASKSQGDSFASVAQQ